MSNAYLFRQGEEPRGIIGSGSAASSVFEDEHWDTARSRAGDKALFVTMRIDALVDVALQDVLLARHVDSAALRSVNWATQSSGIEIPDDAAAELDMLWSAHLAELKRVSVSSAGISDEVNSNEQGD